MVVSRNDKYIVIIIMKSINMKVPPLSQLYQHKHDYEAHVKKLQKIMSDRKHQLQDNAKQGYLKRISTNFERRYNVKSLELARQNSKIVKKIESMKPSINFKESVSHSQLRVSRALSSKSRNFEQERENYRIKNKVQSMSSSLNNKGMVRDYRRSLQIKNRIMHFKTQPNNKVVLKVGRYLGSSGINNCSVSSVSQKKLVISDSLPKISDSQTYNKRIIQDKLNKINKNAASYYNKEEILKNKIGMPNKMFRVARERRFQMNTKQQRINVQSTMIEESQREEGNGIFPTELSKQSK